MNGNLRVGLGTDIHPLVPGDGIWLAGIKIPCGFACRAVSDGDVVLHALVDALLGAAGLGDIGEIFPESDATRGTASGGFVREVAGRLSRAGGRVVNADCVVDLERPKLGPHKAQMRASVAALLGIGPGQVGVKAKTAEGLGPVGEGRAVAAQVVVLVEWPEPAERTERTAE